MGEKEAMTCRVKVANGIVRLPPDLKVPDGTEIQLTIPDTSAQPSFAERYASYIGMADDLPADLASNLDHYLHGHQKK
jgi:hypothetical protein